MKAQLRGKGSSWYLNEQKKHNWQKQSPFGKAQPRKFDLDPSCYCLVTTQVDTKLQEAIDYGYISIDMACTRMLLERKNDRKINVAMAAGYCSRLRSGMNLQKLCLRKVHCKLYALLW